MRFDYHKTCRRLEDIRKATSDHRNTSGTIADLWRVRFDHRKACWRLGVRSVRFDQRKSVGDLYSFGECVLTTAKHVGGLQNFGECIQTTAKRVRDLHCFGECDVTTAKQVGW